jgi:tetratricopeptide (TPR) repeat protein
LQELSVTLKIIQSQEKISSSNIFESAEFWLSKGVLIQTQNQTEQANKEALNYYFSGVKFDPKHFACVYNIACCYFFDFKFSNAKKWFDLALNLNPESQDAIFGKVVCCLKLGLFQEAVSAIDSSTYDSAFYSKEQFTLLAAICHKTVYNDSRVLQLYSDLQEGIRMSHCVQVKLATCSLILLPLNPNRKQVQQTIQNFLELVHLHNCDEYVVTAFESDKHKIDNSPHPQEFLAQYLHSFPFLKRLPLHFLKKQPLHIAKYSLHDLVHASGDDVFLLLSGKVVLRHHQLDSPFDAKILQVGKPGSFIFTSEPNQFQIVFSTEAFLLQLSRA